MGIGVSLSGLASAVADQGGVGVIAAAGIGWNEPDFNSDPMAANSRALAKHIREAKRRTNGVVGVNIMVAMTNYAELVQTCLEEGADIIFSGAGLPLSLPKLVGDRPSPKLAPIVSSGRAAKVICKKWLSRYNRLPDALVVEGPKAGGHLGFKPEQIEDPAFALECIVPDVLAEAAVFSDKAGSSPIPVIAAGGVYTGADLLKYLKMGASGVQMGTRFVATHECDAALEFKQAYIKAKREDIAIIKSPVGMPGRAVRNSFVDDMEHGDKVPFSCPYQCIHGCTPGESPFCITIALLKARRGSVKTGLVFAGQNAYRIDRILSVEELVRTLVLEYEAAAGPVAGAAASSAGDGPALHREVRVV